MRRAATALAIALALAALAVVAIGGGLEGRGPAVVLPRGAFVPSVRGPAATVWAVGDGADGGAAAKRVARRIAAGSPDRVLYLGDVYESGTAGEFRRNFTPVYGRLARVMAPTSGNHDWPNADEGYRPYWTRVRGSPAPAFYAFRAAGWTVLSLNSEAPLGAGSAQLRWLRSELRGGGNCRLAFWHRPRWSAGKHGDQDDVAPLWDALRGRAALVLNGHDHDMQRLRPIDGITELVSGAGGNEHYPVDRRDRRLAFADDTHYGALRLRLRPGLARYAFVTSGGRTLDAGSVRCRRGRGA